MDKNGPFQSFEDVSAAATVAPRLSALRAELAKRGLDGFVISHADEHMGEYLPAHAERLAWLTAFTGSAGAAVVLADKAALFVDGRYTLQARVEIDTRLFAILDVTRTPPSSWLAEQISEGQRIGYDPWVHTPGQADSLLD